MKNQDIYEAYIHSVNDNYYKTGQDRKSYFEKLTFKTKNREILILYRELLTSILYYSEDDITEVTLKSKYITNIRKLNTNVTRVAL